MVQPPSTNNPHPVNTKALSVQGSSALVPVDLDENCVEAKDNVKNEELTQAESIVRQTQILQEDLHTLGMKIKKHEDNLNLLNTEIRKLDDSILRLQATAVKQESSSTTKVSNADSPHLTIEEVNKQILQQEKSAAGILCQLGVHDGAEASRLFLTKDVLGIVAMLGKVEDDNLSRLFSEYLGAATMRAIVCRTYEGVKALEKYDYEGNINKTFGLHGLAATMGRPLDGRFLVTCLESLRPYPGKYFVDDAEQKLDILKPRLPNGECPAGFLGFAVNMIHIDESNLFGVTPSGYGLRETLFYSLFSRLQVYKTRAEMLQALPCISDGALSLDGGMVKSGGVYSLGNREDVDVRFLIQDRSIGLGGDFKTLREMKDMKWKKEKILEDIKRERILLDMAKSNFCKKKNDFISYLQSSSYATQVQNSSGT